MNFAVVDDDYDIALLIAEKISVLFSSINIESTYKVFCSPYVFCEHLQDEKYQAVFLDIDMPELSGFKLSEIIQSSQYEANIIFISNMDNLITTSFRYVPLGFVRKKHIDIELPYAIETLQKKLNTKRKFINVKTIRLQDGDTVRVYIDEIIYIECHNHVTDIHLLNGNILSTRKSMNYYTSNPEFCDFYIISYGIFVNLNHVVLKNNGVKLPNGKMLFGSRRKMQQLRKAYMEQNLEVLI